MQRDIEIFNKIMGKLPIEFTSHHVTSALDSFMVRSQVKTALNVLLHYTCTPIGDSYNKRWRKKNASPSFLIEHPQPTPIPQPQPPTEEECIAFLKATGKYKISRVTWEEV